MAVSGSVNFSVNRDQIITEALELLGVLGEGESPSASQLTSSAMTLNMMVKSWQNRVRNLHVLQDVFVFQDTTYKKYTLDGSTDRATASYVATAVATAQTSGNNTLVLDSVTGMADTYNIGIELDDGTRQWTTINGAPSGTTVTLTANLTDDVAVDKTVIVYQTAALTPYKVGEFYLQDISTPTSVVDTPVKLINSKDYLELSNKSTTGKPNQVWPDYQTNSILLNVWPVANDVNYVLAARCWRRINDFDAASDTADYPQQWALALAYNLAILLAPKYGYPTRGGEFNSLRSIAMEALADTESAEVEESVYFQPSYGGEW